MDIETWYHVVGMVSNKTLKFYVNGTLINSQPVYHHFTSDGWKNAMMINATHYDNSYRAPFYGLIDDIRIYNRALSESEIQELAFVDTDGDGILDVHDDCPNSDLSDTVIIDNCDSGVENVLFDDGCTISDLIWECVDGAGNHGEFVSCVSHLTNDMKKDGIITGKEKGSIQSCAAKANIPNCNFKKGIMIIDAPGIDFDKDGNVDLEYLSEDFQDNPSPFLATEDGSYCDGSGVGSGNRIASGCEFGITDFCALDQAVDFVPGSDNIGTYFTYSGGNPGDVFIIRAFDGTDYYKVELTDVNSSEIRFRWADVSPPECETCTPGQDGMDICFP